MKLLAPHYWILICAFTLLSPFYVFSQSTADLASLGFNYQAVLTNENGTALAVEPIMVNFKITDDGINGVTVYQEEHQLITDKNGMFSLEIGSGKPLHGTFDQLQWSANRYWLEVALYKEGQWTNLGASKITAVPLAIEAMRAKHVSDKLYRELRGTQWHQGKGKPAAIAEAITGDFYMDTEKGQVYKLDNDEWTFLGEFTQGGNSNSGGTRSGAFSWEANGNSGTDPVTDYLGTTDAQDFCIRTNAIEAIRISDNQNVGIGTGNPAAKLHVVDGNRDFVFKNKDNFAGIGVGTTNPKSQMHFKGSSPGVSMRLENNGDKGRTWIMSSNRVASAFGPAGSLTFRDYTSDITRLLVDSNGNVGINTTNPASTLHVNGILTANELNGNGAGITNVTADSLGGNLGLNANEVLMWNGSNWQGRPYPNVAFFVVDSGTQTLSSFSCDSLQAADEVYDIGDNFDRARYTFTAPESGIYSFDAFSTFSGLPIGSGFTLELKTDAGKTRNSLSTSSISTDTKLIGLSTLIPLEAGEKVWVEVCNPTLAILSSITQTGVWFSGKLEQPLD